MYLFSEICRSLLMRVSFQLIEETTQNRFFECVWMCAIVIQRVISSLVNLPKQKTKSTLNKKKIIIFKI